jgi:hypothetical protein
MIVGPQICYFGILEIGLNMLKFRYWKTWDITTENQISGFGD